jgi:hypothetical protein
MLNPFTRYARGLRRIPYLHWYACETLLRMPLVVCLERELPIPETRGWTVRWPARYSWHRNHTRLNPIRESLQRFVRIEPYEPEAEGFDWHAKGGFPVDAALLDRIGSPGFPKDPNDLRGEIIFVEVAGKRSSFALDYSDYMLISPQIREQTDLIFKCIISADENDPKIIPMGYFPANPRLLAVARRFELRRPAFRKFDLYGRFGSWTDTRDFREALVQRVARSSLEFAGGFGGLRPYAAYLQELRHSRMCLDAPGQAPISFRFAEGMALGAVVVARAPKIKLPSPLVPYVHYLPMREDGADVVDVCCSALRRPAMLDEIVRSAARYFDLNFTAEAIARRLLRHIAPVVSVSRERVG